MLLKLCALIKNSVVFMKNLLLKSPKQLNKNTEIK